MKKRILCTVIVWIIVISSFSSVLALQQDTFDYTIDQDVRKPIPKTYQHVQTIQALGNEYGVFNSVQDLFIDKNNNIYIVDTGNSRILKTDLNFHVLAVFTGPNNKPFKNPEGIFVDDDKSIYVADTQNGRVVHIRSDGYFIEEFGNPESEYLSKDFVYSPRKVVVTPTGYLYTMKGKQLLRINANNQFKGYVGATQVGFSIKNMLVQMFASKEQKDKLVKVEPTPYINFIQGYDNYLYASTSDSSGGQIKKLNSIGENIFSTIKFGEKTINEKGIETDPVFADINVDSNGILTAIDSVSARIYQYDQSGNLLTVFGGKGNQKGSFSSPKAIAQDSMGKLYIYDANNNYIQVFQPTVFINFIHQAVYQYENGEYEKAMLLWKKVISIGESYSLAYVGMGDASYKQNKFKEAQEYYYVARDERGYAKAFSKYRYQWFKEHFLLVAIMITFFVVLFFIVRKQLSRLSDRFEALYLIRRMGEE